MVKNLALSKERSSLYSWLLGGNQCHRESYLMGASLFRLGAGYTQF